MQSSRWLNLLRYHHPRQLFQRLQRRLEFTWLGKMEKLAWSVSSPAKPSVRAGVDLTPVCNRRVLTRPITNKADRAARLREGRVELLNREYLLSYPVDWRLKSYPEASHLSRFHLHYHEYLLDFLEADRPVPSGANLHLAWELIADWIQAHPRPRRESLADAWHPFCISRRIPVWLSLWSVQPPPGEQQLTVLQSLWVQGEFLARYLELDVGGNHLLENLRALGLVGAFLEGETPEDWIKLVAHHLQREIPGQILPHGEHFERSPFYHLEMLDVFLDLAEVLGPLQPEVANLCEGVVVRMREFFSSILHSDGGIPLLADSVLVSPLRIQHLRGADGAATTGPADISSSPSSKLVGPYWIWQEDQHKLIFDGGRVGADHLPAHAHCDLLNLEISLAGQRVITDSGVYGYAEGEMRDYCRSTAAHNVLEIDQTNQCDVWSRFRMGYRGWPISLAHGQHRGFDWVQASHNAYRRLGVPTVSRVIACRPDGPWIILDRAEGGGTHQLTTRLHIHPDVAVEVDTSGGYRLTFREQSVVVYPLGTGVTTLESSWYCPEFGQRLQRPVIVWRSKAPLPAAAGWLLTWEQTNSAPELRAEENRLTVHWHRQAIPETWELP